MSVVGLATNFNWEEHGIHNEEFRDYNFMNILILIINSVKNIRGIYKKNFATLLSLFVTSQITCVT